MEFSCPLHIGTLRVLGLAALAAAGTAHAQSLPAPPVPPENPITPAKAVLGKALFWDEQLSFDNTVACGTCHIPSAGGSDPRVDMENRHPGLDGVYGTQDDRFDSAGVRRVDAQGELVPDPTFGFARQVTPRRSPTNLGAAFFDELFWDGRAGSTFVDPLTGNVEVAQGGALESQALGPILSSVEMAGEGRTWADVTTKLAGVRPLALATDLTPDLTAALAAHPTYPALFAHAFGTPDITPVRIAFALATYQRTLHPDQTPWDAYVNGNTNALTAAQRQGLNAYLTPSLQCVTCHPPPFFSDGTYRNLGLRDIAEDSGRMAHTGLYADRGKFKVPTLRNVGLRPRFFHSGALEAPSLFNAVFFYNQGAGFFLDNKDPALTNIVMSFTTAANIRDFLEGGLTDPRAAAELPPFDRPTLRSELGPNATLSGTALPGSGGIAPVILAHAPAVAGDADFRVGVHDALGGAVARLVVRHDAPGGPAPGAGGPIAATPSYLSSPITLAGAGAGAGYGTWQRGIPATPGLVGQRLWFQWLVADPGAARGFSRTRWAELTVR